MNRQIVGGVVILGLLGAAAWLVLGDEVAQRADVDVVSSSVRGAGDGVGAANIESAGAPNVDAPPMNAVQRGEAVARVAPSLWIEYPDGAQAGHARVVLSRNDQVLVAVTAERDGSVPLAAVDTSLPYDVWITGVTYDVHHQRVSDPGETHIRLPDGEEIRGVVTIDGRVPAAEVPIALRGRGATGHVPDGVESAFGCEMRGVAWSRVSRAALTVDGRFRITGCPPNAIGTLKFPRLFLTKAGLNEHPITSPDLAVPLDLVSQPHVRARLVDVRGAPLAAARAELRTETRVMSVTPDDDGAVAWRLSSSDASIDALIDARSDDGSVRGRRRFTDLPTQTTIDVGDIVLEPHRTLDLTVVDRDGRPIAGALARTLDAEEAIDARHRNYRGRVGGGRVTVSDPSDAAGRVRIGPLLGDESALEVIALHSQPLVVEIPPFPAQALTVTLEACAVLEIDVRAADGSSAIGALVQLVTDGDVYEDRSTLGHPLYPALGATRVVRTESQSKLLEAGLSEAGPSRVSRTKLTLDAAQRVVRPGLMPNQPLEVTVVSEGEVFFGPEVVTLAPGEHRVLEALVTGEVREVEGRVVYLTGGPVVDAFVGVFSSHGYAQQTHTDVDGRFVLHGIRADDIKLEIDGSDFFGVVRTYAVADAPLRVVVDRGRSIDVHVVNSMGAAVDGAVVQAQAGGSVVSSAGGPQGTSPYRLERLRAKQVRVDVVLTGTMWSTVVDADEAMTTVNVGDTAELVVSWAESPSRRLVLQMQNADTGRSTYSRWISAEEHASRTLVIPHVTPTLHRVSIVNGGRSARVTHEPATVDTSQSVGGRAHVTLEAR